MSWQCDACRADPPAWIEDPRVADFPYVWHWRQTPWHTFDRDRKGEPCRVLARGTMNSCLLEFEDGYRTVTSRNGLRRCDDPAA
jgi:hypothetical protein